MSGVVRDKWIHVKLSEDERQRWQLVAAASNLTLADLIRARMEANTVDRSPRKTRRTRQADPRLLAWLGRLNSNLNMIAHWANRYKSRADSVQILQALIGIERHIASESAAHLDNPADHHGSN